VVNAAGCYVIPGAVDPHVHMQLDTGSTVSSDTFESGTIAAAHGGTTTIVDFAEQRTGGNVLESFEKRAAEAAGQCVIDWGLHQVLGGVTPQALVDARSLLDREGVSSVKLFMAYPGRLYSDDGQILRALQMCAGSGMMAMVHAENGLAIDVLVEQAVAAGNITPDFHSRTRPPELEAEAVHRAAVLSRVAGNAPLYIVHLSSSDAMREVVDARTRGTNVFAETCPQYLHLSLEDHLGRGWPDGAAYICSTPLRSKHEHHQRDLWSGLRDDTLAVVSTDHCPFCLREQKLMNGESFNVVPNGIGGVEHRVDLIHQGVVMGELTLERWVEVCSTAPARLFGLSSKGDIAPGYDADIVVYDPSRVTTISAETHHMNLDHSAYEGFELRGAVRTVISRGEVIVDGGEFLGRRGRGRYVRRAVGADVR
jgi:dihydropyrimidinase